MTMRRCSFRRYSIRNEERSAEVQVEGKCCSLVITAVQLLSSV